VKIMVKIMVKIKVRSPLSLSPRPRGQPTH
jgi:hypothetical protein